jgi:competence protein ComEA
LLLCGGVLVRRAALGLVLAAVLVPAALRRGPDRAPPPTCPPEGRGLPPRHWLGCAGDPGPRRDLAPDERLSLGLPVDLNVASERELAFVPGITRRLARKVVEYRVTNGDFRRVDELLGVEGIGPKRLEWARPSLVVTPRP